MEGKISRGGGLDTASMEVEVEKTLRWKREVRPITRNHQGLCVAPHHYAYLDELMKEMQRRTELRNPLSALLLPLHPPSYRVLFDQTAQ